MAKQKRQKKAGLVKRKQDKRNKKRLLKKRLLAQKKPAPKKMSMSKVKKNLKNLPLLVFEPELQEIRFSSEEIERARAQHAKLPEQIEAVATDEFQERLKAQLELLKGKYDSSGDVDRGMMVNALQYFMEQENTLTCMNQIVVGMFFAAAHTVDAPDAKLTLDQLNLQLKEYDKAWADYFKERLEAMQTAGETEETPEVVEEAEAAPHIEEYALAPLLQEFTAHISDVLRLEGEAFERTEEDIEILLDDYCTEREIASVENLTPRKIKSFLEGWFIRNMHPTEEDLGIMIDSIATFVEFLKSQEKMSLEAYETISAYLQNREAILAHIGA